MLGTGHGFSGLAVGAATLPAAPIGIDPQAQVSWVLACGGMALLPDWDTGGWSLRGIKPSGTGSTVARMWGPISITAAQGIGFVARGHRNGTHDAILGTAGFACLAWLAGFWPITTLLVVAIVVGAALHACAEFIPGDLEEKWPINFVASWAAAFVLTEGGAVAYSWLPFAVALGVLTHIAGDWLTKGGVPVPFTILWGKPKRVALSAFVTGSPTEHRLTWWVLFPAVVLLVGWQIPAVRPRMIEAGNALLELARLVAGIVAGLFA